MRFHRSCFPVFISKPLEPVGFLLRPPGFDDDPDSGEILLDRFQKIVFRTAVDTCGGRESIVRSQSIPGKIDLVTQIPRAGNEHFIWFNRNAVTELASQTRLNQRCPPPSHSRTARKAQLCFRFSLLWAEKLRKNSPPGCFFEVSPWSRSVGSGQSKKPRVHILPFQKIKSRTRPIGHVLLYMVGVTGFEPAASWSRMGRNPFF